MKKKTISVLAVASIAMLLLGGCGKKSTSKSTGNEVGTSAAMKNYKAGEQFKASKNLDVSILYQDQPTYPYNKNWLFWKELTKKTNVTLKPTIVPYADYSQKRSLLISSGDAPTIMAKTYPGEETQFVSSGTILPVSDYIKYMPNFRNAIKKWKLSDDLETIKQSDGKYYVLPGVHEEIWPDYSVVVRTDILKKNGIAIPKTWDDFEEMLTKLKEKYPDSVPFSDRYTGNSLLNIIAPTYGTKAGWGLGNAAQFVSKKNKYVYAPTTSEYKSMVSYLHSLVSKGLMDKASFSQKDEQATQKFVTGKSFVISGNAQSVIDYETSLDENVGKGEYSIAKIDIPAGPKGALMGGTRLENGIMISSKIKKNKNFKAILQFIDWLWYSPDGQDFAKWGVKGTTYNKSGDKYTLAKNINFLGLNPSGKKDLRKDYGFSGGNFAYGGSTNLLQSTMSGAELDFQKSMAKTHKQAPVDPAAPIAEEDQQQASLLSTPLSDFTNQNTLKFITGERPMSEYSQFISELKKKGSDKYIEMINKAYKNYQKNEK